MQPVHYHNKKQSVKHMGKKQTAQFKYVVKSVPLSYAKHFVLRGYWNGVKQAYIKGKLYFGIHIHREYRNI